MKSYKIYMELFRNSKQNNKRVQRVGRGGKRGTTSGRGTKGQKSRSGHRIRPAERDLLIRLPKLRGYRNKSIKEKQKVLNLSDLANSQDTVFNKKNLGLVKILGGGELKKPIIIEGLPVSKSAKIKIEHS